MSHQPLPWHVDRYGDLRDRRGKTISVVGVSLPCGIVPANDKGYANRDLIVRNVTELSEDARQQVIASAESRGAAATREAIAKGMEGEAEESGLLIVQHRVRKLAARIRAGELG